MMKQNPPSYKTELADIVEEQVLQRTGQGMQPPRSRIGFCPSFCSCCNAMGAIAAGCSATASDFFAEGLGG